MTSPLRGGMEKFGVAVREWTQDNHTYPGTDYGDNQQDRGQAA